VVTDECLPMRSDVRVGRKAQMEKGKKTNNKERKRGVALERNWGTDCLQKDLWKKKANIERDRSASPTDEDKRVPPHKSKQKTSTKKKGSWS